MTASTPSASPPSPSSSREARGLALVSGASVGIGAATVRRLAADGWRVIAAARRAAPLQALADELGRDAVLPWVLDVTDAAAVAVLPGALPAGWQAVDLLVNNAGLALGREPAQASALADWRTMVATNIEGLLGLTHALLPGMVARGRGHVIHIGSIAGHFPYPGGHVYGASKAFVHQFTLGLKADLIGTGVRATVVEPGMVADSEFSQVRFKGDTGRAAAVYEGVDALHPGDVAEAIAWVAAQPAHVNVSVLQLMPTDQGPGPQRLHRRP
jgi:3-hydroxy acid dehydrogenase/malonic semialdehyde reductase